MADLPLAAPKNKKRMTEQEKLEHFLAKKSLFGPKKEPVWVYLEREMIENAHIKPYNKKVGDWLKLLKELRYFYFIEALKNDRKLKKDVGPVWYIQLSGAQSITLKGLKDDIHKDLIEDIPKRTQRALYLLGITPKIPDRKVMKAMKMCEEDPGLFVWYLYTETTGNEPSKLCSDYGMNEMIMMSSLVAIDIEECIQELEILTHEEKPPPPPPPPKTPLPKMPPGKYGMYLQDAREVPLIEPKGAPGKQQPKKALPLGNKFKFKTESFIESSRLDRKFLDKRADRNKKQKQETRVCNYKFWEPPTGFRDVMNPEWAAMQKMFKRRPVAHHKTPYDNQHFHIGGVSYCRGKPYFIINSAVITQTGFIPVHGGLKVTAEGYTIPIIQAMFKFPEKREVCEDSCDCMKWHDRVMRYLGETKCSCGHLYDFKNEGRTKAKYFAPPTRHGPFHFDEARIYEMDPLDDMIKETVQDTVRSETPVTASSQMSILPAGMKIHDLLNTFLATLASTPLIIPHLPLAAKLPGLYEWCRHRVRGDLTVAQHERNRLYSSRKWSELERADFKARAYTILFTEEELRGMNWSHRKLIGQLFHILLDDFVLRNRVKQLEQARIFFATMMYEKYPSKPFLETFYTYMPGRLMDTYIINPFSAALLKTSGGKTCPLS